MPNLLHNNFGKLMMGVIVILIFLGLGTLFAQDSLVVIGQFELPSNGQYIGPMSFSFSQSSYRRSSDINHDGFMDYIQPYHRPGMNGVDFGLYLGKHQPSEYPDIIFPGNDTIMSGAVASFYGDLNGDGWNDLVTTYQSAEAMYATISIEGDTLHNSPDMFIGCPYWGGFVCLNPGCDFNNDGFDDIVCFDVPWEDWSGNVDILYGGNPMNTTVDVHFQGEHPTSRLGAIYAIGDINGDTIPDLILSEIVNQNDDPLFLNVYLGGTDFSTTPSASFLLPQSMCCMYPIANVDFNGDGFDDIILTQSDSLYVLLGNSGLQFQVYSIHIPSPGGTFFGCNINNDDYDDIVIKLITQPEFLIYCGGTEMPTQPTYSISVEGTVPDWGAGSDLGDISGDGYDDILISNNREEGLSYTIYSLHQVSVEDNTKPDKMNIKNYPNPFHDNTAFKCDLPKNKFKNGKIEIFNIKGQKIKEINIDSNANPNWDSRDYNGNKVASGVYFYKVVSPGYNSSFNKMLYIK